MTFTSPDYRGQRAMHYNYLAETFDRARLREGVRLALDLAGRPGPVPPIGKLIEPEDKDLTSDDALDQWLLREVTTCSHI